MNAFLETKENLTRQLNTDPDKGLTTEGAAENAARYGTNAITREKPESLLKRLKNASKEPMILLLIVAGLIAVGVNVAGALTSGHVDILEVVGIFLAIALSVVITVVMEGRSAKAFEALNRINEDVTVRALRNGETVMLNQKDIVAGDILLPQTGDKIPADGRLLESSELAANESALTGESVPAKKDARLALTDAKTPVAERRNMLYSGTYVTGGFGKMLVTAVGDKTEFGQIARELSGKTKTTTPLQERLGRMGKVITIFGVFAALVVFAAQLVNFARGPDGLDMTEVMEAFVTSIVLIVAAVPEGLPAIVAISLSINIVRLSKKNALVKKMVASETVGCINVICSDKTGTLTENKMTVVHGIDDAMILQNICVNSTAEIGADGLFIGNPTECALLTSAEKGGWSYRDCRQDAEIAHVFPFSSEEKDMTTVVKDDPGYIAYTKGSPEKIFRSCGMDENERAAIEEQMRKYQEKACRIIAFAHRIYDERPEFIEKEIESGMSFDGFAAIADPLRADVFEAVESCKTAGIDLKILTGDNIVTATAIANELGILGAGRVAVESRDIESLSDEELSAMLPQISVIARSTPTIKMRVVNLLKEMGNVVAVTGDGINDAPALKNADVGIAMGIAGTEVSKEASDIVLLDDAFSTIVGAIRWGRGIYDNFKRFIMFQLTTNVSSVTVMLTAVLLYQWLPDYGFVAPFSAIQLLWVNIIMDGPPALTLGLEPIHGDMMTRPPVKRSENILTRPMLISTGLTSLYISGAVLLQYAFNYLGVAEPETYMQTVLFAMFSMLQILNVFNCRDMRASMFKNLGKSRRLLLVAGVTVAVQFTVIQFAGAFFGTVPLPGALWLKILGMGVSVIALAEIVKLGVRLCGKR